MDLLIVFLMFIVVGINMVYLFVMYLRGFKDTLERLFLFIIVGATLYPICVAGDYLFDRIPVYIDWLRLKHFLGFSLSTLFFYFMFFVPHPLFPNIKKIYLFSWGIPYALMTYFVLFSDRVGYVSREGINYTGDLYLPYVALNFIYIGFALLFTFLHYIELRGTVVKKGKRTITAENLFVFFLVAAALIGATGFTNLVLPAFGIFNYLWIGAMFVMIVIGVLFFAIFKYHATDTKVAVTEFSSVTIIIVLLYETFFSNSSQEFWISLTVTLLSTIFIFLLVRSVYKEVSAREEMEMLVQNLSNANSKLKELDEQKTEFVSVASHQLRSPLAAIRGYASMILEGAYGTITGKQGLPIQRVYDASRTMANTVEDFLNISRIEQGRMHYVVTQVDMRKIVKQVVDEMKTDIKNKKLKISFKISGRAECVVRGDREKLKQVVIDLIENSIKYTYDGHITIKLKRDKKEKRVILTITDTGVGLSQKTRRDLFQKFNRGDEGIKTSSDGSGVGLFISREIVRAHGGDIIAESEGEGKGATFTITLPEEGGAALTKKDAA